MITPIKHRKSAGFSLIEVAIASAIMLLIAIMVVKFWGNTSEAFTLDSNTVILKQQSERAMEVISERIARADVTTFALSNGNSTLDFTDGSNGSAVQYTINPLAPATPPWGQIVQTVDGVQTTLAGYVQTLQFTQVPGTNIVTIDASFAIGAGRTQSTLLVQSHVAPRN